MPLEVQPSSIFILVVTAGIVPKLIMKLAITAISKVNQTTPTITLYIDAVLFVLVDETNGLYSSSILPYFKI